MRPTPDGRRGSLGGISFEDGAHDQTWDGFDFADTAAQCTGITEAGGHPPRRTPYNITVRDTTTTSTCTGRAGTADGCTRDHGMRVARAVGVGPHDILVESLTVDGRGNLAGAARFDHGDAANPPARNVTVGGRHVTSTQQAIILWSGGLRSATLDGADTAHGVRSESRGASGVVPEDITSVNPGYSGFRSSMGANPPGVALPYDSFR